MADRVEGAAGPRSCNCVPPTAKEAQRGVRNKWHAHGSLATCPPEPPEQTVCSPSLAVMGQCYCPQHRMWREHPETRPAPLPPLHGPLELDDAVGAWHDDDCETCAERRRTADYPEFAWGPL